MVAPSAARFIGQVLLTLGAIAVFCSASLVHADEPLERHVHVCFLSDTPELLLAAVLQFSEVQLHLNTTRWLFWRFLSPNSSVLDAFAPGHNEATLYQYPACNVVVSVGTTDGIRLTVAALASTGMPTVDATGLLPDTAQLQESAGTAMMLTRMGPSVRFYADATVALMASFQWSSAFVIASATQSGLALAGEIRDRIAAELNGAADIAQIAPRGATVAASVRETIDHLRHSPHRVVIISAAAGDEALAALITALAEYKAAGTSGSQRVFVFVGTSCASVAPVKEIAARLPFAMCVSVALNGTRVRGRERTLTPGFVDAVWGPALTESGYAVPPAPSVASALASPVVGAAAAALALDAGAFTAFALGTARRDGFLLPTDRFSVARALRSVGSAVLQSGRFGFSGTQSGVSNTTGDRVGLTASFVTFNAAGVPSVWAAWTPSAGSGRGSLVREAGVDVLFAAGTTTPPSGVVVPELAPKTGPSYLVYAVAPAAGVFVLGALLMACCFCGGSSTAAVEPPVEAEVLGVAAVRLPPAMDAAAREQTVAVIERVARRRQGYVSAFAAASGSSSDHSSSAAAAVAPDAAVPVLVCCKDARTAVGFADALHRELQAKATKADGVAVRVGVAIHASNTYRARQLEGGGRFAFSGKAVDGAVALVAWTWLGQTTLSQGAYVALGVDTEESARCFDVTAQGRSDPTTAWEVPDFAINVVECVPSSLSDRRFGTITSDPDQPSRAGTVSVTGGAGSTSELAPPAVISSPAIAVAQRKNVLGTGPSPESDRLSMHSVDDTFL